MAVSVVDCAIRITLSQFFSASLAVDDVVGASNLGKVGRLVNECSSTGVSTGAASAPEDTAKVDGTESKRQFSEMRARKENSLNSLIGVDVSVDISVSASAVECVVVEVVV